MNPTTISIELAKIYSDICLQTKIKSDEKILLRFIIHCACMLERQLLNPEYDPTAYEVSYRELPEAVSVIKMAFRPLEVSYNLLIPPLKCAIFMNCSLKRLNSNGNESWHTYCF